MNSSTRHLLVISLLLALLISAGPRVLASEQDDKDDIIAKQQQFIDGLKKQLAEREKRERELLLELALAKERQKAQEVAAERFERFAKDMALQVLQTQKANERLLAEIQILRKTIDERDARVVKAENELQAARLNSKVFEQLAQARQTQNEALLEQIRELTRKLAALEANKQNPPGGRDPNPPNPPEVLVQGKIEKIDGNLVQINLGTDHGVKKGHTLEVFRLQPEPKYLGMLRIVESFDQKALGQIINRGGANPPMIREGDRVTSRLTGVNKEAPKDKQ